MTGTTGRPEDDVVKGTCSPPLYQAEMSLGATHVLLCVAGELDLATAPCLEPDLQLALAAAASAGHPIAVDLNRVRFCDLRGLYALLAAARTAASGGHRLAFVAAPVDGRDPVSVRRLLDLLDRVGLPLPLPLYPSITAAVAA